MFSLSRALLRLIPVLLLFHVVPAAATEARPALWRVADEDTEIFLFGTLHALPPGIDWLHDKLVQTFESSDELVTEILETEPVRLQALVAGHAMLPADTQLRQLLRPDDRTRYEAALSGLNIPAQAFDRFEPWYAAISLAMLPLRNAGFTAEHGIEAVLAARARALGQRHVALETVEYQLGLLDALSLDVQKRYLAAVVKSLPTLRCEFALMVEAWKDGDMPMLAKLMNVEAEDPRIIETLLTRRNRNWTEWVVQRLAQPGTVFVAVGAGHLAGTGSVQDELRARGIAVERVQ